MQLRRAAGLAALLALLAGSCSSDDDADASGGLADLVEDDAPAAPDDDGEADETEPVDDTDANGPVETADVDVDAPSLPPFGAADDDAVGLVAPGLTGTSIDGRSMSITPGDGPTIVGFFAHWCPHCQAEVPVVVDWLADGGLPDDVELLAVSTAVEEVRGNFPPSDWFAAEGWDVPTMADDARGSAHIAYGGGGFPYWVVLDAQGVVVARTAGELPASGLDELVALARG